MHLHFVVQLDKDALGISLKSFRLLSAVIQTYKTFLLLACLPASQETKALFSDSKQIKSVSKFHVVVFQMESAYEKVSVFRVQCLVLN